MLAWSTQFDGFVVQFRNLWNDAVEIWLSGGWAMIAIACVSLVMFALGSHIFLRLQSKGFQSISERTWRRWIEEPDRRRGAVGRLLTFAMRARTIRESHVAFQEIEAAELHPFQRDLKVMRICVGAAPLLGLLGTVTGMLTTFGALATGSGGEKTMALVAKGISEALVTTETGLVIALPGLLFQYQLTRGYERYKAFLAQVECVLTQRLYARMADRARQPSSRSNGSPSGAIRSTAGVSPPAGDGSVMESDSRELRTTSTVSSG